VIPALQGDATIIPIGRDTHDFSQPEKLEEVFASLRADWVVNCAAYTDVDTAEHNEALAHRVNCESALAIAQGVKRSGGRMIQLSTDYIFNGRGDHPYREDDPPDPICAYGRTKLAGETAVRSVLPEAIVLRTAWVYSKSKNNFVAAILERAMVNEEICVVDDEVGAPTWSVDVANAIKLLIGKNASGTFHFTNSGQTSRLDFAQAIISAARHARLDLKVKNVLPGNGESIRRPANRPKYTVLDTGKISSVLRCNPPHWKTSLETMLRS